MRTILAASVLAIWAGQAVAASVNDGKPAVDPHAGCLHNDLTPCMMALGSTLWFDVRSVAADIAKRNELDVNGRTAHRDILINARVPGHTEQITIILTLASPAPNDKVIKAEVELPPDIHLAHTASEYDATFLYDTVSVLLGRACPNLDKMTLYRFFENQLKPGEAIKVKVIQRGTYNYTQTSRDTGKVPLCGFMFSLHWFEEQHGLPGTPVKPKVVPVTRIDIE